MKKQIISCLILVLLCACAEEKPEQEDEFDRTGNVKACIETVRQDVATLMPDAAGTDEFEGIVLEYCECAVDGVIENGISQAQLDTMSLTTATELASSCLEVFQTKFSDLRSGY